MTQMTDSLAAQTDTLTAPVAQDNTAIGRRKYSGNEVLRIMKALNEARLDMDRKFLSMNEVVHILQDRIEEMLQSRRFSYADLARIITGSGFPVTERTLKDYLAKARKDAKEGRADHSELKELILAAAQKQEEQAYADAAVPFPSADDDSHDKEVGDGDLAAPDTDRPAPALSSSMDDNETADMKKHIQDIYAARKRRKKARKHK